MKPRVISSCLLGKYSIGVYKEGDLYAVRKRENA